MNEEILQPGAPRLTAEEQADFLLLMSLALDGLADDVEVARFRRYLSEYPVCAQEWRQWQRLHQHVLTTPAIEPPVNFVANVDRLLVQQERRQQLQRGALMGVIVALLWGGLLATVLGMGIYLMVNPGNWLNDLIHNLALISTATTRWFATTRSSLNAFLSTPQATALGIGYLASAVVLLSLWLRFLQRSTAMETVS
jgi:anti-sigma factor RsiW